MALSPFSSSSISLCCSLNPTKNSLYKTSSYYRSIIHSQNGFLESTSLLLSQQHPHKLSFKNHLNLNPHFKKTTSCSKKKATENGVEEKTTPSSELDCVGTGLNVECVVNEESSNNNVPSKVPQVGSGEDSVYPDFTPISGGVSKEELSNNNKNVPSKVPRVESGEGSVYGDLTPASGGGELSKEWNFGDDGVLSMELIGTFLEWGLLISPFFFWGTAMVAMKEVLPKTGPFFIAAFRLVPAGLLLVGFAAFKGRNFPAGFNAWFSITLFALIDAACFQGFLAEGLQRTSAGLGSVIIDSQPLTVAVLAALLFGESIGFVGAAGLVLGVIGLLLLEVPALSFDNSNFSLWGSGEWWMFLAAQSMAVGTVMVRWVSKYSDPVMATGWHMVIGGLPLVAISVLNHDPVLSGSLTELTTNDLLALLYTSIFGTAISYGVYFYNATRGSLTKLSSLTFLTPMFASIFGYLYLDETFTPVQLMGAVVTVAAIYLVNYKSDAK